MLYPTSSLVISCGVNETLVLNADGKVYARAGYSEEFWSKIHSQMEKNSSVRDSICEYDQKV